VDNVTEASAVWKRSWKVGGKEAREGGRREEAKRGKDDDGENANWRDGDNGKMRVYSPPSSSAAGADGGGLRGIVRERKL
jgi:hypothetical protein